MSDLFFLEASSEQSILLGIEWIFWFSELFNESIVRLDGIVKKNWGFIRKLREACFKIEIEEIRPRNGSRLNEYLFSGDSHNAPTSVKSF